jgi:hypothetical protein
MARRFDHRFVSACYCCLPASEAAAHLHQKPMLDFSTDHLLPFSLPFQKTIPLVLSSLTYPLLRSDIPFPPNAPALDAPPRRAAPYPPVPADALASSAPPTRAAATAPPHPRRVRGRSTLFPGTLSSARAPPSVLLRPRVRPSHRSTVPRSAVADGGFDSSSASAGQSFALL